jgi:hypothetical protein
VDIDAFAQLLGTCLLLLMGLWGIVEHEQQTFGNRGVVLSLHHLVSVLLFAAAVVIAFLLFEATSPKLSEANVGDPSAWQLQRLSGFYQLTNQLMLLSTLVLGATGGMVFQYRRWARRRLGFWTTGMFGSASATFSAVCAFLTLDRLEYLSARGQFALESASIEVLSYASLAGLVLSLLALLVEANCQGRFDL